MTEREFHSIFLPLSGPLYRVAMYILESAQDAEDALQETFLRLWTSRDALDSVHNPKAYAMTMLRNLCLDRIRAAKRDAGDLQDEILSPDVLPDEAVDSRERLAKVLDAVKSLPERQREVLVLRTVHDLSYEEISERTGMNYLTLRVLLSRARSTIKNKI